MKNWIKKPLTVGLICSFLITYFLGINSAITFFFGVAVGYFHWDLHAGKTPKEAFWNFIRFYPKG